MKNFYDPFFVEPNFELENVVLEVRLRLGRRPRRWRGSLRARRRAPRTRAGRRRATRSWRRRRPMCCGAGRRVAAATACPRRPTPSRDACRCTGRSAASSGSRHLGRSPRRRSSPTDWSTADDRERRGRLDLELDLPPGRWDLSLQYDATRPLTLTGPDSTSTLPGNLDYRGPAPSGRPAPIDRRRRRASRSTPRSRTRRPPGGCSAPTRSRTSARSRPRAPSPRRWSAARTPAASTRAW